MSLSGIGIDATQEQVYRALVANPDASTSMLAGKLGLPEKTVADALEAASGRGLVARSAGGHSRYVPAPPALALGALLAQYREDLRQVEVALTDLAEEYREATEARSIQDVIEVVVGVEAIRHRFDQIQRSAVREVQALVTGQIVAVSHDENNAQLCAQARGVSYRLLVERGDLEVEETVAVFQEKVRAGVEVRVAESLPMKLIMADRASALVALVNVGNPAAVMVHTSGLLDGLVSLFEHIWRTAVPLRLDASGDLDGGLEDSIDPLDAKILGLLLAGLTDEAVSGHLGLSPRTVQRRVRTLMDHAGAKTRLQLGWYAARHGWV